MDSEFTKLKNASTSTQLKDVVDGLPRSYRYFTGTIRNLILQKQNLIIDVSHADSVVSFVSAFSCDHSTRELLRTADIHDLIIDILAPKISEGQPIEKLGRTICNIVQNQPAAELYASRKTFSAILDCFHRATTAESGQWIVTAIINICHFNPDANKILNDLPVVEAFSAIIPHATREDSVKWISNSIENILNENEYAQKMFGTLDFLEQFRMMERYATSSDAKTAFKKIVETLQSVMEYPVLVQSLRSVSTSADLKDAVDAIPRDEKYYTAEILDLLLQNQNLVIDAPSADAVVSILRDMSSRMNYLLRTAQVRDLIIDVLAPKISADDPVENLGRAICSIVQGKSSAQLYSDGKSLSAILDCFHRATTAGSARCIATSINNICCYNTGACKILHQLPAVEAFSAAIPYATDDQSVRWLSANLAKIWNDEEPAQKQLKAPAFIETFRSLMNSASSGCDVKFSPKNVVDILRPIVDARVLTDASPSNSNVNALISQLKKESEKQVEDKEAQLQQERAEHEKTRALLHQMKMQIGKESGQRREREDEDEV